MPRTIDLVSLYTEVGALLTEHGVAGAFCLHLQVWDRDGVPAVEQDIYVHRLNRRFNAVDDLRAYLAGESDAPLVLVPDSPDA